MHTLQLVKSSYEQPTFLKPDYSEEITAGNEQYYLPLFTTRLVHERNLRFADRIQTTSPEQVATVLRAYFMDKDREEFVIVLFSASMHLIGLSVLSIGGLQGTVVEPRQVFKVACLSNASSVIVAHNHPSGQLIPSKCDHDITDKLVKAGDIMGIPVQDHLIITHEGYYSFSEEGFVTLAKTDHPF